MKESKYNYCAEICEDGKKKIIFLNGITGKMLVLSPEEYQFLRSLLSCTQKHAMHPELIKKLYASHFLVENDEAELNLLREKNREAIHSSLFSLTINPTLNCNFHCWYCYETHQPGRMSEETMRRIKLLAFRKFHDAKINSFSLGWFGGEPLLYFKQIVYPLSKELKEEADKMKLPFSNSITTNGYLLLPEVAKMCADIDLNHFQITLDGDRETHDKIRNCHGLPSFDRILDNCIALLNISPKAYITLRINYTTSSIIHTDYSKILEIIPGDIRSRFSIQFHRVWQTYEKEGNDAEVKKSIVANRKALEEAGFSISSNTLFSLYKGNICYADRLEYANINYDGLVYKCTAQDYNKENALGYLDEKGDIVWKQAPRQLHKDKADFENPVCLDCNYLPLCGGPCFSKRLYMEKTGDYSCPMKHVDTDLDTFIRESYRKISAMRKQQSMQRENLVL